MNATDQILGNVVLHTICTHKSEDENTSFSKFSYEYRFCEDEEIKEENTIITNAPAFTLTLTDKEDCSSAKIHILSNLGHFLLNVLEAHSENGCPICVLKDIPQGMTISEFIDLKAEIQDGFVH